jgi:uncharacterized protein YhaN
MRIEHLDLLAYGHLRDLSLDLASPRQGVTIIFGPNEAGKSTAMRGLNAALFGLPADSQDAYLHGRYGLRVGAHILRADGSEFGFIRQGISKAPLIDENGDALEEKLVAGALGSLGRQTYARLFSINHDQLRMGSEDLLAGDGEIGRLVFGASFGSGSVNTVLQRLDKRSAELYLENGRAQVVTAALRSHRETMKDARAKRVRSREWDRRVAEETAARAEVETAKREEQEERIRQQRLERVQRSLPLAAERERLLAEVEELGHAGLVASPDWFGRAEVAIVSEEAERTVLAEATKNVENLVSRLAEIDVPGVLMTRASDIDELVKGIGQYNSDASQLPERLGQRQEVEGQIRSLRERLGMDVDHGRAVTDIELKTVEELAQAFGSIDTALVAARRELDGIDAQIARAEQTLNELPEALDVASLERAVKLARPVAERERSLSDDRAAISSGEADARARAGRLGLSGLSLAEVRCLRVPSAQQIAAEQGRRARLEEGRTQLEKRLRDLDSEHTRLLSGIDDVRSRPGVPDPERLGTARERRGVGWQLVRGYLEEQPPERDSVVEWTGGQPLADAFESALDETDIAADERNAHSEELAALVQLSSQLEQLERADEEVRRAIEELECGAEAGAGEWRASWEPIGMVAGSPEEMSAWRDDYLNLDGAIAGLDERNSALRAVEEAISVQVLALRSACEALGRAPESDRLQHLVEQAQAIIDDAGTIVDGRRGIEAALRQANDQRSARSKDLARAEEDLEKWRTAWSAALDVLGLPAVTLPSAALEAVRAHRDLRIARDELGVFDVRITGMKRDMDDFRSKVDDAARELVEVGNRSPSEVAESLNERLGRARRDQTRREAIEEQLETEQEKVRATSALLQGIEQKLSVLREETGIGEDEPLQPIVDRSREVARRREQIEKIDGTLVAQGAGRRLEEILREVSKIGMNGDELAALLGSIEAELEDRSGAVDRANRRLGEATGELQAVSGSGEAADLEQDAEEALARAVNGANEYAMTALAAWTLRNVVSAYGERHRGPILDRAGEILCQLTAGGFVELLPETVGSRQLLLVRRSNGEVRAVHELSDGVRDQLYLALRLAGLEYQLGELAEPLPVVLDDLLVNFDDDRSAAALEVLSELGERTQVLLFTHHEGVVAAAEAVLAAERYSVVRLAPRDQHLLVPLGQADESPPPIRVEDAEGGKQAVLRALRSSGTTLSKAEIVAVTGMDDVLWTKTIRELVGVGAVLQEGERRGARYRLPR